MSDRRTLRVAAVIVHFRTPRDTSLAVASLLASTHQPIDIVVVNNDRVTDGGSWLAERRQAVLWHENGQNAGFSGGVNAGIRVARSRGADAILLVNSDATVTPQCVEQLVSSLLEDAAAGIAGPTVLFTSAPDRIQSLGLRYRAWSGRLTHTGFGERHNPGEHHGTHVVDAVAGCLMLIRSEAFDRAGMFDEDFFFGYEEVEFCLRCRQSGFSSVVNRDAVAHHAGSVSIGPTSYRRLYFAARNHLLLAHKVSAADGAPVRAVRNASIVSMNVAHALKAEGGSATGRLRAVASGTADYFAGRYGSGGYPVD